PELSVATDCIYPVTEFCRGTIAPEMTAPDGSVTVPRTVPLLMDCGKAGKALRKQARPRINPGLPKLYFIICLHVPRRCLRKIQSRTCGQLALPIGRSGQNKDLGMEARGRAGKMQRRNEFALRGRSI